VSPTDQQPLQRAQQALGRGDIDAAIELVDTILAGDDVPLDVAAGARFLLGGIHYFEDDLEAARDDFEFAYRANRDAGEPCRAARAAIAVAEMQSGSFGNGAVAQGWLARARRLLEGVGPCVDWGWYELALVGCDRPDVDELLASADRALKIAQQFRDSDLEVRALADGGLALVSKGQVRDGIARLDEAMAAIVGGDVRDPAVAGLSFCAMLSACERIGDVRRAEEWMSVVATQMLEPLGGRPRVLHTHCRLAYGAVLSSAGRWGEAEREMLEAIGPTGSRSFGHRVEAIARLAELRLHQGKVDEAAELLAAHEDTISACGPLAQVHLRRGQPALAAAHARRGLRELVGDVMRAAPLWALVVEAEVELGDADAAANAAGALATLAANVPSPLLHAYADLATGRALAARGDHEKATAAFVRVHDHLAGDPRPLLGATARLELAISLLSSGNVTAAAIEARTALGAFERLGAAARADQTRALLRRLGAPTSSRAAPATDRVSGLTAREAEVLSLVREGLTNGEIASRLFISAKTAEHHVGRILTKLGVRTRAEAAAVATAAGHGGARQPFPK
jgi:DNA-binding CsgD family transcriptional regulator